MKKAFAFFAAVLYLLAIAAAPAVGGGATGGSTEPTQIANNGELVASVEEARKQLTELRKQLEEQIKMVKDMMLNSELKEIDALVREIMQTYNEVMGLYSDAQGLLGRLMNVDEEFYGLFMSRVNDYTDPSSQRWMKNYAEAYFEMSEGMEKYAEDTRESLKTTAGDITDSGEVLGRISDKSTGKEGRNAILQSANDFLGFIGGELIKTRALLAEQTSTYLTYIEQQRTMQAASAAVMSDDLAKWKEPEKIEVSFSW